MTIRRSTPFTWVLDKMSRMGAYKIWVASNMASNHLKSNIASNLGRKGAEELAASSGG